MALLITKAKPNPSGRDRIGRTLTPVAQLAGEWVDIQNTGNAPINLTGVELYHWAYLAQGGEWELVTGFSGVLGAGLIVRVHSGNPIPLAQMHHEDQVGANYHMFSGRNYVWNNYQNDYPRLWYKPTRQWLDETVYAAPAAEGKIFTRVGQQLV